MRPLLMLVLALAFVVSTTADRVACPDGCTDDHQTAPSGFQDSSPPCAFCHGWNDTPRVSAPAPLTRMPAARPAADARPVSHVRTVSDPPPRTA